eukprot:34303-Amphidinium_carterae.1
MSDVVRDTKQPLDCNPAKQTCRANKNALNSLTCIHCLLSSSFGCDVLPIQYSCLQQFQSAFTLSLPNAVLKGRKCFGM